VDVLGLPRTFLGICLGNFFYEIKSISLRGSEDGNGVMSRNSAHIKHLTRVGHRNHIPDMVLVGL
jgi:hypothetical protein